MANPKKSSRASSLTAERCLVDDLYFDSQNARIDFVGTINEQDEILKVLWRDFAVDEIALSIAANGFFEYEPLFAAREHNRLVVIEGNRRLAAVKLLRDADLRKKVGATDLPRLKIADVRGIDALPVIICSRDAVWQHLGFKHINGPQAWGSEAKAKYVAWVHGKLGISLDTIASTIGDTNLTVQRLYRAHAILEQAEQAQVWKRDDRSKIHFAFSHLSTGLNYSGIQAFLGIKGESGAVPKNRIDKLGELLVWLYGSKSQDLAPVVRSQNPDLRLLDEALKNDRGITALRRGMPLAVSVEISRGDERIFRECVQAAKQSLQKAIGVLLTGYKGDGDLLETAEEIVALAQRLQQDVQAATGARGSRSAPTRKK